MSIIRHFECGECFAFGTIKLKGDDNTLSDIICCPVCGADITEEDLGENDE